MIDTTDTLQIQINKAKALLPKQTRGAIDAVDWRAIILGMNKKYNSEQLDDLETETELLLYGLVNPVNYPKELEIRMKISSNEANLLISDLDRLVFKKIQEEVVKRVERGEVSVRQTAPLTDPLLTSLPNNLKDAIEHSDYQKKLYAIGAKYKLQVPQMASLEEITVKFITGAITASRYESDLAIATELPATKVKDIAKDVNDGILVGIRKYMQQGSQEKIVDEDTEVPIPPYKKVVVEIKKTNESVLSPIKEPIPTATPMSQGDKGILASAGIEMMDSEKSPIKESILASKLFTPTKSASAVSDQTIPKIVATVETSVPTASSDVPKAKDPYHEEI